MAKARRIISKGRQNQVKGNRLPIILALGGAVILILAAFLALQKKPAAYTPAVTGRPNLTVDKEMVDLGEVKLGSPVKVSFELQNTGDQPLRFSNPPYIEVKEGC